jgi:hypothetical protein
VLGWQLVWASGWLLASAWPLVWVLVLLSASLSPSLLLFELSLSLSPFGLLPLL